MPETTTMNHPLRLGEMFDALQSPVNCYLSQAIARGSLPRLIAFTGPAGFGKGTRARIIARRHSCERKDAHPFEPCAKCSGCLSVDEESGSTRSTDWGYTEFDATALPPDKILDIMENEAHFRSIMGSNRHLFFVDELTRARKGIQERLLRFSENTRCGIIIATIDHHTILPELLDRFVHLRLQVPTLDQVVGGLIRLARAENRNLHRTAAQQIARACQNNPRLATKTLGIAITLASDRVIDADTVKLALDLEQGSLEEDENGTRRSPGT